MSADDQSSGAAYRPLDLSLQMLIQDTRRLVQGLVVLTDIAAKAIEARRATDSEAGVVGDESAVTK